MEHGLAATIDQLVSAAVAHPGTPQRRPLARGLRVDVMVKDAETHVQISRDNTWPSHQEWTTVTRAWPSPVPNIAPRRMFDKGRYYLTAKWTTVQQPDMLKAIE